jgi:hypothetical protein
MLISITLMSCGSYRNQLLSSGDQNQAILNAIIDFSNTNVSYKKYSVFHVTFYDTLYRKILEKESERNFSWVNGKPYKNIIAITISGSDNKHIYQLTEKNGIGTKGFLPPKYTEKDGKLFIWYDDNIPMDEKTLSVLKKYELVSTDEPGMIRTDERKKGAHYYFCRKNLKKYKKKVTNIAIGYYDAPKIDCD